MIGCQWSQTPLSTLARGAFCPPRQRPEVTRTGQPCHWAKLKKEDSCVETVTSAPALPPASAESNLVRLSQSPPKSAHHQLKSPDNLTLDLSPDFCLCWATGRSNSSVSSAWLKSLLGSNRAECDSQGTPIVSACGAVKTVHPSTSVFGGVVNFHIPPTQGSRMFQFWVPHCCLRRSLRTKPALAGIQRGSQHLVCFNASLGAGQSGNDPLRILPRKDNVNVLEAERLRG